MYMRGFDSKNELRINYRISEKKKFAVKSFIIKKLAYSENIKN